jgi:hypothetical protein
VWAVTGQLVLKFEVPYGIYRVFPKGILLVVNIVKEIQEIRRRNTYITPVYNLL